jgi:hypothetical protein
VDRQAMHVLELLSDVKFRLYGTAAEKLAIIYPGNRSITKQINKMYVFVFVFFLSFLPGRLIEFITLQLFSAPEIRMCASTQSSLTDFNRGESSNL